MNSTAYRSRIVRHGDADPRTLAPNPRNPRRHPKAQRDAMAGILEEVGWLETVIYNETTGRLVNGHLRVEEAIRHGDATVPVTYVEMDEATEALALVAFDRVGWMAENAADVLDGLLRDVSTGNEALQAMIAEMAADSKLSWGQPEPAEDPGAQIDRAEELREKWGTERGQLWEVGAHRLLCGDSTDAGNVARLLGGARPESVVFDPEWDGDVPTPDVPLGGLLAFTDGRRIGDCVTEFGAPTWVFVWDGVTSWYTPNRPLQRGKFCAWYGEIESYEFDGAHYGDAGKAHTVSNPRGTYAFVPDPRGLHLSDVYQEGLARLHGDGLHPHEKPIDWVRMLIGNCLRGNVYDPYLGSGTTMVACEQLGRKCYAGEISPAYVAVTLERLSAMGLEPRLVA